MKDNRNTFFYNGMVDTPTMPNIPIPNMAMSNMMYPNYQIDNNLEARISNLEKKVNYLENRISKLETPTGCGCNKGYQSSQNNNYNSEMYMM